MEPPGVLRNDACADKFCLDSLYNVSDLIPRLGSGGPAAPQPSQSYETRKRKRWSRAAPLQNPERRQRPQQVLGPFIPKTRSRGSSARSISSKIHAASIYSSTSDCFVIASSRSGSGSIKVKRQRASLLCPTSPKQLAGDPTDTTSDSHEASMPKQRRSVVPCPESNLGAAIPSAQSPPPEIMRIERICCMYAYMCLCM